MKAGFAKFDITPRVGVSMAGFGPFLNRNSTGIRDRLEARAADGRELPFYDFASLTGGNNEAFTVVSRDICGCDVTKRGALRLTLLRSPYCANHDPRVVADPAEFPLCDRGMHEFEFTVFTGSPFDPEAVADEVDRQTKPIHFTESTRGCARLYVVPHIDLP